MLPAGFFGICMELYVIVWSCMAHNNDTTSICSRFSIKLG